MKLPPPGRSIRRELTIRILAGTLLALLATGAIFLGVIHRQLVGDFDRMLAAEAAALVRNTERKDATIIWDVPEAYSQGSRENADPAFCQLFLEDGTVVGLSQTLGAEDLPRVAASGQAVWNLRLPNGRRGRAMQTTFLPHVDESESQTSPNDPGEQIFAIPPAMDRAAVRVVLVVAHSREELDALLVSLYLAGGVLAVLLACAVAWLVRRAVARGLQPVEEINAQISAITPDALAARLHVPEPPVELAAVERTVNGLLDRVEEAFEKERRFSSDLAHELRTPIAELRTASEVAARWPDDAESTRAFFRDARTIALQLEAIVATLLALARCEDGRVPLERRRIALRPMVRECWRQVSGGAEAMELRFDARIADDLAVESDGDKLAMILRNLAENAVVHSEPGTVVECLAAPTAEGVELRFLNVAKDLERADLEHVFDRFWRKDASRSDRRHVGLGLSIVRALCATLGLRLQVDLHERQLFEARIVFPRLT